MEDTNGKIVDRGQTKPQGETGQRPDPEVTAKAQRRQFSAEYKRRILQQADGCAAGTLGVLLRREGLYSSHLAKWRRQREAGVQQALSPQRRGRPGNARLEETENLRRDNERLAEQLRQAELIIEVQKKLSTLLGLKPDSGERN